MTDVGEETKVQSLLTHRLSERVVLQPNIVDLMLHLANIRIFIFKSKIWIINFYKVRPFFLNKLDLMQVSPIIVNKSKKKKKKAGVSK